MPSQVGTNARQAALVQKARSLTLEAVNAINELRELKLAKDNNWIGLDPSNNPADPSSFLDATAVKLGYNDATLCRDNLYAALDSAANIVGSGDFQNLILFCGYYMQPES